MSVNVSFREAVEGVEKQILVKKKMRCGECEGSRCLRGTLPKRCWTCYGKGVEVVKTGPYIEDSQCKACQGSGLTITHKCPNCYGQGVVLGQNLEVLRIRQFVEDGDMIKFEYHGNEAPDSYNGDLYLTVFIDENPTFERSNFDLIVHVPVSYATSILGGTVKIPQLDGSYKEMKLEGVPHKSQIVIADEGLFHRKLQKRGKQIIIFEVDQGPTLTPEETQLFNKLKELGL